MYFPLGSSFQIVTLLSPVETASILLVNDQLTCQATLLNSCKTVCFHMVNALLPVSFKSQVHITTFPL